MGGGFSHYINRDGLACDSIVGFEVVLATGDIIYANYSSHRDLFQILKGGGSSFGIVTRVDMQTFKTMPMWGGAQIHMENATAAYISATKHWTDGIEEYQAGSAVIFWSYRPNLNMTIIIAGMADVSGVVEPPAFQELRAIPNRITDSMAITNMSEMSLATQAEGYRLVAKVSSGISLC